MSSFFLKNRLHKKINQFKVVMYLCVLASFLFVAKESYYMAADIKEKISTKKRNENNSNLLLHSLGILFYSFLTYMGIKEVKRLPVPSKRPTVSDKTLSSLIYCKSTEQTNPYTPLTEEDIINLTKKLDFSSLDDKTQYKILQNIIRASSASPFVAKILKSDLLTSTIQVDPTLKKGGVIGFGETLFKKASIKVQTIQSAIPILHEIFHARQVKDGASFLSDLNHYARLTNEASAKALDLILYTKTNLISPFLSITYNPKWVRKILDNRLQKEKYLKPILTYRQKGFAEEETIGIIMKCLLESDPKKRETIVHRFCGNILNEADCIEMHLECEDWRQSYITNAILQKEEDLEEKLTHTPNLIYEINYVSFFDSYNSAETHIPQSFESIKISKNEPHNILFKFFNQDKQNLK